MQDSLHTDQVAPSLQVPDSWIDMCNSDADKRFCVVTYQKVDGSAPLVVTRSLVVNGTDRTWQLHIHGHLVNTSAVSSLLPFPSQLDNDSVISELLSTVDKLATCVGNPEPIYVTLGKAKKTGNSFQQKKK